MNTLQETGQPGNKPPLQANQPRTLTKNKEEAERPSEKKIYFETRKERKKHGMKAMSVKPRQTRTISTRPTFFKVIPLRNHKTDQKVGQTWIFSNAM